MLELQGFQSPIWFVTGYEEAKQILSDHTRFVKDYRNTLTEKQRSRLAPVPELYQLLNHHMLGVDQPDHTRLRAIVSKAFTVRRVEALAPRIQQISDELINAFPAQDPIDLIDAYAFPLPIIVICELLGVPAEDRNKFRLWSNTFVEGAASEGTYVGHMLDFFQYIADMVTARRQQPYDDLITALVQAEANGDRLSEQELYSMVSLLIVAGHETTVNLIANRMLALLQDPGAEPVVTTES
jgi:cytochrome P450